MDELPAGRDLDIRIAVEVMGWTDVRQVQKKGWQAIPPGQSHRRMVPFYSTEIAAAWQVVEEMTQISRAARQESTRFAYWWDHACLWADTAAEAAFEICGAALRAVQAPMGKGR